MKPEQDVTPGEAATQGAKADKDPTAGQTIAIASLLIGPLILAGQAVYWLIYRDWLPLPVSRILELLHIPVPSFSGRGEWIEKFEMVLGAPTSIVLFMLAIVVYLAVFETSDDTSKSTKGDETKSDGKA